MLEHVCGINGIGGVFGEGKPISDVQPQVNLIERIRIDVGEALDVFGAAAEVKMLRPVRWANPVKVFTRQMVG
jgi:hypothetical protein